MKFYVYALFRPSGEIFYVGKGKGNRINAHWSRDTNIHVARIIAKAKRDGVKCSRRILRDKLPEECAFTIERILIATLGREDLGLGPLVNLTDGGEGLANPCAETRARLCQAQRVRVRKPHSEESKAKVRASKAANPWIASDESRAKLSAAHKKRIWAPESREKCRLAALAREAAMTPEQRSERARQREMKKKERGFKTSSEARVAMSAAQKKRRSIEGTLH